MNGFMRLLLTAAFFAFSAFTQPGHAEPKNPRDPSGGQIIDLDFSYKFGLNAPGLDQFDALGTYVLGSGSNGLSLPANAVVVSAFGGGFIQAIPSNSFTAIAGGWRYASTNPGVSEVKIMNNGALTIRVRKSDFSQVNSTSFGPISLTVGDDVFTAIPNSIPVAKIVGPAEVTVGSTVVLDGAQSTDFNTDSLTHTWLLVSEPLGSNISLSSTNILTAMIRTAGLPRLQISATSNTNMNILTIGRALSRKACSLKSLTHLIDP